MALTAAHALLGNKEDAGLAARGLLYRRPNLTIDWIVTRSQITDTSNLKILTEGLRLAGNPEK
jgi:hypothetical protein